MKRPGNFSCRMSCLTSPDERSTGISLVPRVRLVCHFSLKWNFHSLAHGFSPPQIPQAPDQTRCITASANRSANFGRSRLASSPNARSPTPTAAASFIAGRKAALAEQNFGRPAILDARWSKPSGRCDRSTRDATEMHSIVDEPCAPPLAPPNGHGSNRALLRVPHMPSVGETPLSPPGKGSHFEREIRSAATNRRLRRQQLAWFARVE
jgi:hypothetical protein